MPVTKIVESLNKLSVLELVELKKALESEWDVTAAVAAPVAAARRRRRSRPSTSC
jgi:ribosomal protein L7/L12